MSAVRQRTAPPSRTGDGRFPALRNRHRVRTDTPNRLAKLCADTRSDDAAAGDVSCLPVNTLGISGLPGCLLVATSRHERSLSGEGLARRRLVGCLCKDARKSFYVSSYLLLRLLPCGLEMFQASLNCSPCLHELGHLFSIASEEALTIFPERCSEPGHLLPTEGHHKSRRA
jgi:hypothetical protein